MRSRFGLRGRPIRRYLLVSVVLLVVVGALIAIKAAQIGSLISFGEQMEAAGPPPEAVGTAVAKQQPWESTLSAVGTVTSVEAVAIRNEVAGKVTKLGFESGADVKRGAILVELDAGVERSELATARARRNIAATTLERTRTLVEQGAFARARLDDDEAALQAAQGQVDALEAQVAKKVIRAPFAGRTGIRSVNLGQYLEPGTRITVLSASGDTFVDFSLPQEELAQVEEGTKVRVLPRASETVLEGTVAAIEPTVDPGTRNAQVRAQVKDPGASLAPGMFVDVEVVRPGEEQVVVVPATAVVHASFGDSVFVIEAKQPDEPGMREGPDGRPVWTARQQFVRLGQERGDFVVVQEGLEPGAEVVTAGAFKLRNGAPVVIDNRDQARPQLDPKPENR